MFFKVPFINKSVAKYFAQFRKGILVSNYNKNYKIEINNRCRFKDHFSINEILPN